jgi:TPR repeat protein
MTGPEALEFERLRGQAEAGDIRAQVALANMFAEGCGIEKDEAQAASWYQKAARERYAEAERGAVAEANAKLGDMYREGRGVSQDEYEAFARYNSAAQLGSIAGQFNLGRIYADRQMSDPSHDQTAVHWYRNAACEDARAAFALGLMYETGRGVRSDGTQAAFWFEKAIADSGSATLPALLPIMVEYGFANPHFIQGLMFEHGWAVALDDAEAARHYREAIEQHLREKRLNSTSGSHIAREGGGDSCTFRWCRSAAEQGDSAAQNALGEMYEEGWGTDSDPEQALEWYRRAAERGLPQAQINLGRICLERRGMPRNPGEDNDREAVLWFRRAADQGLAEAQYRLGLAYVRGRGVEEDREQAFAWFRKAAEQGHGPAQNELAVVESDEDALALARRAAAQGFAHAQYSLGKMYLAARPNTQWNAALATFWFLKAVEQGNVEALIELTLMLSKPGGGSTVADSISESALRHFNGILNDREALAEIRKALRDGAGADRDE